MKKEGLVVSEVFYSIQGEGQTAGVPAVFLRLAGCNLLCESKSWRCDTIEVWQKGKFIEFEHILPPEYIRQMAKGAHLVVTGGEPMIQQENLIHYLQWLRIRYDAYFIVEIETNGTVPPYKTLLPFVDYWNVSFKLSSCGEPYSKRVNELALDQFNILSNAMFKIVICNEGDIMELVNDFLVPEIVSSDKIILMPAGENNEQLSITRPLVAELCKAHLFKYSDRLHVAIWNKKTGV